MTRRGVCKRDYVPDQDICSHIRRFGPLTLQQIARTFGLDSKNLSARLASIPLVERVAEPVSLRTAQKNGLSHNPHKFRFLVRK